MIFQCQFMAMLQPILGAPSSWAVDTATATIKQSIGENKLMKAKKESINAEKYQLLSYKKEADDWELLPTVLTGNEYTYFSMIVVGNLCD